MKHPAEPGTYEFVSSQMFGYGSQSGGWLEVGWVESDGFTPSTGDAQKVFTYDPQGGGWQLHYNLAPNAYYSYKLARCAGSTNYCAYVYLNTGQWGLLRTSAAASACTSSDGCRQTHILVEVQSTSSNPHPGTGANIPFYGMYLRKGGNSYLWDTSIPNTSETTDATYLTTWQNKWHQGYVKGGT